MDGDSTIAIQRAWMRGGWSQECFPPACCPPSRPSPGASSHEALIFIFSLAGPYTCAPHAQLFIATQQRIARGLTNSGLLQGARFLRASPKKRCGEAEHKFCHANTTQGLRDEKPKALPRKQGTLLYLGSIYVLTSPVPTGNCLSGFPTDENSLPPQLASDGRRCTLLMLRGVVHLPIPHTFNAKVFSLCKNRSTPPFSFLPGRQPRFKSIKLLRHQTLFLAAYKIIHQLPAPSHSHHLRLTKGSEPSWRGKSPHSLHGCGHPVKKVYLQVKKK